ncbi:MAG: FkbM family methyltransferase [Planctomycetaceae bacterium]|nr:FkbM family methyltransferase [Planctomycetaceae bacterium]
MEDEATAEESNGLVESLMQRLQSLVGKSARRIVPLYEDELLVETKRGFYLVVPNWNIDVAIGIVRDGQIEPWTNEMFLSTFSTGDTVVNVGANFGYYSVMAGHRVGGEGKVYAVEANPHVFRYLLKSIFWGGVPGIVSPYLCAAAAPDMDEQPIRFTFDPQFIGGGNMFTSTEQAEQIEDAFWSGKNTPSTLNAERMFVPTGILCEVETEGRTLDRITADASSVKSMLIDAEGSESYVIAGAQELIRRSPELEMIVEWDPSTSQLIPERTPYINSMWDFLLDEQKFEPFRICHEGFKGKGHLPELTPLNRESLYNVPHSDIYLRRQK